jgi:dynamin 1-like protein
LDISQAANIV